MARGRRPGRLLFKRIGHFFCCQIILIIYCILFIVNNGNILTDGRTRYYRKKTGIEKKIFIDLNKLYSYFHWKNSVFIRPFWTKNTPNLYAFVKCPKSHFFKFCSAFFKSVTVFAHSAKVAALFYFCFLALLLLMQYFVYQQNSLLLDTKLHCVHPNLV